MLPLSTTLNKTAIRQRWDARIIEGFSTSLERKLNYFGLPGPDIQDFFDWRPFLAFKTGVEYYDLKARGEDERKQRERVSTLQKNVMLGGFNESWELRRGAIEDLVTNGADVDGNSPGFLIRKVGQRPRMRYDLHNWDFCSGIGFNNKRKEDKRIDAIQTLMSLQRGHSFLLLLTVSVRHTLGPAMIRFLKGSIKEFNLRDEEADIINWCANQSGKTGKEHQRVKAAVPLMIRQWANVSSFDCYCYPVLYYQGWGEHLLHFVMRFVPEMTPLPSFSKQSTSELINLPILKLQDGNFHILPHHPMANEEASRLLLNSLDLPLGGLVE